MDEIEIQAINKPDLSELDLKKLSEIKTYVDFLLIYTNLDKKVRPNGEEIATYIKTVENNFDVLVKALKIPSFFDYAVQTLTLITEMNLNSDISKRAIATIAENLDILEREISPNPNSDLNVFENLQILKAVSALFKKGSEHQKMRAGYVFDDNEKAILDGLNSPKYMYQYTALLCSMLQKPDDDKKALDLVDPIVLAYLRDLGVQNPSRILLKWERQNDLSDNLAKNLPVIIGLERKNPGIIKFLTDRFHIANFNLYSYSNLLPLLEKKYREFLASTKDASYNSLQEEKELLTSYGFDARSLCMAWKECHDEWLFAIHENMEKIKALEKIKSGSTQFLNYHFGIINFARYPVELLIRQIEEFEDTDLPYGIILYPESDYNGAFYQNRIVFDHLQNELRGKFALRVFEVGSEYDIKRVLLTLNEYYGYKHKISFAIIGGHGSKNSIEFGFDKNLKRQQINIDDLVTRQRRFIMARSAFEDDASFLLISCRTGGKEGIAKIGANLMVIGITGPKSATNIKTITPKITEQNGNRKIKLIAKYKQGVAATYQPETLNTT